MTKNPYPVLAPRGQIPVTHLPHLTPSLTPRISLTQRILTPLIVCATLVTLLLCVVAGIVLTVKIFGNGHALALVLRVGTGFVVVGSSLTLIYLILHFSASIQNNPVGFVRPPELKLHACSFITARVTLVSWMLSIIVSSVVVSKSKVCVPGTTDCKVQIGGLVLSCIGLVATGIILTALEACQYPFQLPGRPNLLQEVEINCRVSSFDDDLVDSNLTSLNPSAANILQSHLASVSVSADSIPSLPDDYLFMGNEREEWEKNYSLALAKERITRETNIKRKPVPTDLAIEEGLPKFKSQVSVNSMPGEFPEERENIVPLRPRYTPISELVSTPSSTPVILEENEKEKEKSKSWGLGWSYFTRDTSTTTSTATELNDNEKCVTQSDSAISLGVPSNPSTGHSTCGTCAHPKSKSSNNFISQRIGRQRNVTPSSSIIDASMRSPLSTMRTAESPETAIKPDVALVPTTIPSSLDRTSPRKPPITQPLPIAILNEMMIRRPSVPAPSRMPGGFTKEYIQSPSAHVMPLKRKPVESDKILNRPPKSWKDALPVRGGSFEIERKPLASSKEIPSHKSKNPALNSKPKQKAAEPRPSLKSWKDSLPIRGGSFDPQRSTANIRDVFPNITRGPLDQNHNHNYNLKPISPLTTTKPAPLAPKKKTASQKAIHTPHKSPNTAIVIKKRSTEMQVPGAFIEYSMLERTKERPTSREMKIPGAFIESVPSTPEFEKNQEEETIVQKKPQGVRPLKLRPKGKVPEKEKENQKVKEKVKAKETEPRNPKQANKTSEVDEPETLYKPAPLGPHPFKRRLLGRANVETAKDGNEVETAQLWKGMDWARVEPLRKLSLGEVSSGMGNLWDD
ncbi:uncharacterized protein EAE97_006827 [Botrytis byssoidea]|uniref:Uncharacterized protein n=1 Tax=Botrytis byssoidea TaxID=139641 RepID=A0A9P5IJ77_9HELO|nr:uncharacterized protein EAE97_006827 [Botrytis byssoidea]KAF7940641.1 hypothetical protein EAE97_006827 [Botrytis byssoidea]